MKLNIIYPKRPDSKTLNFAKNGAIYFKKEDGESLKFKIGERWAVGTDDDDPERRHLYILRSKKGDIIDGYKMKRSTGSWHIQVSAPLNNLSITIPARYSFEVFQDDSYEGFKILIKNIIPILP